MTTLALASVTPTILPSPGSTGYSLNPGASRIKYGGDYESRVARSVNAASLRDFTMAWDSIPISEAQALEDFLEGTRGVTKFNITGCSWISTAIYYVYVSMNRSNVKPEHDTVSVKLERVFA